MYTKDKSTRITLRLSEAQFAFVKRCSDVLGVSPSEWLRMIVNSAMYSSSEVEKKMKGELRRENEQTNIDSII